MFLALQDKFLTSGLPGKSLILFYAEQYSVMCLCVYKYIHTEVSLSIYPLMDTESCFHILAILNNAAGKCACIFSS